MDYNQKALDEKLKHLDEIKKHPEILKEVIIRNIGNDYTIEENHRIWCGGGGTSYIISTANNRIFLKIKNRSVSVESKLEEESSFIDEPCIEHEMKMLECARDIGVQVPETVFYDEEGDYQFLATEYIQDSLLDVLKKASVEEILNLWDDLVENVHRLYFAGIVHSDIHEYNLRVRDGHIILIDLEEARLLVQKVEFEHSLDYCGNNGLSMLGEFPLANEQDYTVKVNSLLRMRQVFKDYLVPNVVEYIKKCNYDSESGICTALDHGKSELTYQSIKNAYFSIAGQRGIKDKRPDLIEAVLKIVSADENWTFIDVGSNNGLFCREISKRFDGTIRAIGLEGYHNYNVLAKALGFIDDCKNIEYIDFICGEDDVQPLGINNSCFIAVCSVWHHIQNKDAFVEQLKVLDLKYVLLEMPVQTECYGGRSWEDEISIIKKKLGFAGDYYLANSDDYDRPMILISKDVLPERLINKLKISSKRIFLPNIFNKICGIFNGI